MERSMLHADNAYFLEHVDIQGRVVFTNHPPTTAFRGFGGPQGMAVIENAIQEIAIFLRGRGRPVAAFDIQRRNLYGTLNRNETPYGQTVIRNHLRKKVIFGLGVRQTKSGMSTPSCNLIRLFHPCQHLQLVQLLAFP